MANITRVKPGGWAVKEVYTSAQKNATDDRWLRCAVNDGQTDLQANASFSGGATRSFAFAALTTFGVTTSAGQSYACTTHALTASGAVTIGAATYTLTASGAVIVNADDYTLDAGGDVVLDAGLDFDLNAGQDITLSPGGTWGGLASKLSLSGTGWPILGSRNIDGVPIGKSPTMIGTIWAPSSSDAGYPKQAADDTALGSQGSLWWPFWLPPGTVIRAAKLQITGVSGTPANAANFGMTAHRSGGTSQVGIGVTLVTDPGGTGTRTITLTPSSPYTVQAGDRMTISVRGYGGAGFAAGLVVREPTVDITVTALRLY